MEKIKNIILEQLDVEENEVTMDSRIIEDLGADSLDIVEILSAVEEEFDVTIEKERASKIHTIKDIKEYLEENNAK